MGYQAPEKRDNYSYRPFRARLSESVLQSVDLRVARIASVYIEKVRQARREAPDKKDAMAVGRAAEKMTKEAVIGHRKDQIAPQDVLRNQTGVDGPSGGGDLRSVHMLDLTFREQGIVVRLELQTSNYKGKGDNEKNPQWCAQQIDLREGAASSQLYYRVIPEVEGRPKLEGWTQFDKRERDLSLLISFPEQQVLNAAGERSDEEERKKKK